MRVKTDERRSAILAAAWEAFTDNGFERTTMSDISERAGGSKATIYNYFSSKDELFAAVLEHGLKDRSEESFQELASPGPLSARLLRFARADIRSRLSEDMTAVERMLVAEAGQAIVGSKLDEAALGRLDAAARAACRPIDDKRGTVDYRIKIAGVLARRAAAIAYQRAGGAAT